MGRRVKQETGSSLKTLILFCVAVFFVIAVSLTYKAVSLFQSSSFDGNHLFVVGFIHGNNLDIVGLYPDEKKMTHLAVSNVPNVQEAQNSFGILLDGEVALLREFRQPRDVAGFLQDAALLRHSASSNLSIVDLLRLSLFARTLPPGNIETKKISLSENETKLHGVVRELFSDQALIKENITIQVVNGTDIPGLGNRVERLLLNRGAVVISVINADTKQKVSRIEYFGEKSYTLEKMSDIVHVLPVASQRKGIADIILIVGSDRAEQF